jgi:hypothetical protein
MMPGGPYYSAVGSAVWSNEPNASSQYNAGFGFGNGDTASLYCYAAWRLPRRAWQR